MDRLKPFTRRLLGAWWGGPKYGGTLRSAHRSRASATVRVSREPLRLVLRTGVVFHWAGKLALSLVTIHIAAPAHWRKVCRRCRCDSRVPVSIQSRRHASIMSASPAQSPKTGTYLATAVLTNRATIIYACVDLDCTLLALTIIVATHAVFLHTASAASYNSYDSGLVDSIQRRTHALSPSSLTKADS